MNNYIHGNLYIGNIKIDYQIVKENVLLIYDVNKDVFYGIEVLNELIDIETKKDLNQTLKTQIEEKIKKNTYTCCIEKKDNTPYIDESSIIPFSLKKTKYNTK